MKTKELLIDLASKRHGTSLSLERRALQEFGDRLDRETQGRWVRDALVSLVNRHVTIEASSIFMVDAVRIIPQIKAVREAYGFAVTHIHLKAPQVELAERYKRRDSGLKELKSFKEVERNVTEERVRELEKTADVVIDTKACDERDVLVRTATHLGWFAREYARLVDVIVGGQYGSEGKGHIASYLAREYAVLVRVGGPNAGHKVLLENGPYIHHQLPSGTLRNPAAKLIIAPGAVINPQSLLREINDCKIDHERLTIDPQAMIITDKIERQRAASSSGSVPRGRGSVLPPRDESLIAGSAFTSQKIFLNCCRSSATSGNCWSKPTSTVAEFW